MHRSPLSPPRPVTRSALGPWVKWLGCGLLAALASCASPHAGSGDPTSGDATSAAARATIDAAIAQYPGPVDVGIWWGPARGSARIERDASLSLATASAIKTAYLVELFAEHAGHLDEPLPGAAAVVDDPEHPAVRHFQPDVQQEIRSALRGATVREVGFAMIRSRLGPDGPPVSNAVYNAAANLTTAVLGGPEALTRRLHARFSADPAVAGLHVRRYMLARRDVTGDNSATAAGLAAVLGRIADGSVPGVDAATLDAVRSAMSVAPSFDWQHHFAKTGALDSDPQCRIQSGWVQGPRGTMVYAVMAQQPRGEVSAKTLDGLTRAIAEALLAPAPGPPVHPAAAQHPRDSEESTVTPARTPR